MPVALPVSTMSDNVIPTQSVVKKRRMGRHPASREASKYDLSRTSPDTIAAVIADYKEAKLSVTEIAKKHGISDHVCSEIRRRHEDSEPSFNLARWKKATAATLSHFVTRGSERLAQEVQDIPLTALPIGIAIAVDKILLLHDSPQHVTEHRLAITHDQINKTIMEADVITDTVSDPVENAIKVQSATVPNSTTNESATS